MYANVLGKGLSYNFRLMLSEIFIKLTIAEELCLDPKGVLGRDLREEHVLNSSGLRFSEHSPSPSLRPLLMELLSSQLKQKTTTLTKSMLLKE